jgi:hypothetical protein
MPYIENQATVGSLESVAVNYTHLGALLEGTAFPDQSRDDPKAGIGIPPSDSRLKMPDERAQSRYAKDVRMTARILKDCNVPYVYSFCPTVYELKRPAGSDRELAPRVGRRRCRAFGETGTMQSVVQTRRSSAAATISEEQQTPYAVMDCLQGQSRALFLDECHLNDFATGLVAADLAERIPDWIKPSPQVTQRDNHP